MSPYSPFQIVDSKAGLGIAGLEPATIRLKAQCSTNWAIHPKREKDLLRKMDWCGKEKKPFVSSYSRSADLYEARTAEQAKKTEGRALPLLQEKGLANGSFHFPLIEYFYHFYHWRFYLGQRAIVKLLSLTRQHLRYEKVRSSFSAQLFKLGSDSTSTNTKRECRVEGPVGRQASSFSEREREIGDAPSFSHEERIRHNLIPQVGPGKEKDHRDTGEKRKKTSKYSRGLGRNANLRKEKEDNRKEKE